MSDESFNELMGKAHVVEDHRKVVLRGAEEVGAEYNGQSLCGHMVVLFALRYAI